MPFPCDGGIVVDEQMAIRVVRLGSERVRGEGLRIGTVRRPPRGVAKSDHASRDFYDVWLPDLAPSAEVIAGYKSARETAAAWRRLERLYRAEMKRPERERLLKLLAEGRNGQLHVAVRDGLATVSARAAAAEARRIQAADTLRNELRQEAA